MLHLDLVWYLKWRCLLIFLFRPDSATSRPGQSGCPDVIFTNSWPIVKSIEKYELKDLVADMKEQYLIILCNTRVRARPAPKLTNFRQVSDRRRTRCHLREFTKPQFHESSDAETPLLKGRPRDEHSLRRRHHIWRQLSQPEGVALDLYFCVWDFSLGRLEPEHAELFAAVESEALDLPHACRNMELRESAVLEAAHADLLQRAPRLYLDGA